MEEQGNVLKSLNQAFLSIKFCTIVTYKKNWYIAYILSGFFIIHHNLKTEVIEDFHCQ